jgi:Tfp pilus assembly protein PilF
MSTPFLSSEEYDERAHALYDEGQYEDALTLLREGLGLYPNAVALHVGVAYARLARDEFMWARKSFEESLVLDPEHEDALAGLGEVLLRFGQTEAALRAFDKTIALGYEDDVELMMQIGRALFREGHPDIAIDYFERATKHAPDSAEALACVGYAQHRQGRDGEAIATLRRALVLDESYVEARIYLANVLYDEGEMASALAEFERSTPEDHWDELGIWRLLELKKSIGQASEHDPQLAPWESRLETLSGDVDAIDEVLAEVEQRVHEQEQEAVAEAQGRLETLGGLLRGLAEQQSTTAAPSIDDTLRLAAIDDVAHRVVLEDGSTIDGTWTEIVTALRDRRGAGRSIDEYMAYEARRHYGATGARISAHAPEVFLKEAASAGLFRLVK